MEKRKADGEKNRGVASSFRKTRVEENGNGNARLQAQKELDARREATRIGLLSATASAIGTGSITDLGDGQPYPHSVVIDGGLSRYVDDPVTDEPIEGFSAQAEQHAPITDPETWAAFCSRETRAEAEKILAGRGR